MTDLTPESVRAWRAAIGAPNDLDLDIVRNYWRSPTGADQAPPGLVPFAQQTIWTLCDEVEQLRNRRENTRSLLLSEAKALDRVKVENRRLHKLIERLRELLEEVASSGVVFCDPRSRYVEIQIDCVTWESLMEFKK